jgi:hypothetical protein
MNELAVLSKQEETTATLMRRASDVAGVCKQIVLKTALQIQGRKYVRVEGWQAIATAHGCMATAKDVEKIEGGWRAIGEIRRITDGMVLCNAEGFVGTDEVKTWAQRPEYACRAMAQTRAISRVCRSAFAHVVVLMDAGLSTTPAEEVPADGFDDAKPAKVTVDAPQTPAQPVSDNDGGNVAAAAKRAPKDATTLGGVTRCEVVFVDYKHATSKPDAPKQWEAWFCDFEDYNGNKLSAGTFDKKMMEKMDVLKGQYVSISYKAGKQPGKFELLTLDPADDLKF